MVLKRHLEISNFIKKVHEDLREKSKSMGVGIAWQEHCADNEKLCKYALAMKELATCHWENSHKNYSSHISRISWVYQACMDYFTKEIFNIRAKESEVAGKIDRNIESFFSHNWGNKWKLLDVGSCYNPFKRFNIFEVTAVDIAPAETDVNKCDFLEVSLGDNKKLEKNEITQLPTNYFDVVVFSLLLEYLPSPLQRKAACKKAYDLLKTEGILLIITPDSNHVGSNAKYMKSWRFVLAEMGFSRTKYVKLEHIHSMVFRKCVIKDIPIRWANIHKDKQIFNEMFIPQDFKIKEEKFQSDTKSDIFKSEDIVELNKVLPFSNIEK